MQEGMTTRLAIVSIVTTLSLTPAQAFALVATEISPQDVYQAAYCNTFVAGAVSARTEQIAQEAVTIIRLYSDNLIAGEDNLAFVPLGEAAARSDLIQALSVREGTKEDAQYSTSLSSRVEECAEHLTALAQAYRMNIYGYGRNRKYSEKAFDTGAEDELDLINRLIKWLE
jgi:hypothetical protein